MFAVIKTGGKQYKVAQGDVLKVEKLNHNSDEIVFDEVLLMSSGDDVKIGNPTVSGAKVKARVLEDGKSDKKRVFRYKSKTRQRKLKGHRQPYTLVKITDISHN
jgi:large subunit ribosomal protein L21